MKKVFITINGGSIARNLLKNDFFDFLTKKYKVFILTQGVRSDRFINEFSRQNVEFIDFSERPFSNFFEKFIVGFYKLLIYNPSIDLRMRYGVIGTHFDGSISAPVYLVKKIVAIFLSKIFFLRSFTRFVDRIFFQRQDKKFFLKLLNLKKPDLVFSTNIMGISEAGLLNAAKKLKIKTIGMPKSWDNPSKGVFRTKADKIIVWSKFMASQVEKYQDYKPSQIEIIGIPQHDYFHDKKRIWSKEKFCAEFDIDPHKKIIFFGSEGKQVNSDSIIAKILSSVVNNEEFVDNLQLLIRPHTGYLEEIKKFECIKKENNVVVDDYCERDLIFKDVWDYSDYFMDRFLNSIYHSDIIINTASTLSLDALVFDKPIIHIYFDGYNDVAYDKSIRRWYSTDYYKQILKFNASILADSKESLEKAIKTYLDNPKYLSFQRKALREEFSGHIDGKSGMRLFNVLSDFLDNK